MSDKVQMTLGCLCRITVPVLPFGQEICLNSNRIKLPNVEESSTSIVGDKHPAGCRQRSDMATFHQSQCA